MCLLKKSRITLFFWVFPSPYTVFKYLHRYPLNIVDRCDASYFFPHDYLPFVKLNWYFFRNKFAKNNNVEDILRQPFDDRVFDFNTVSHLIVMNYI